MNVFFLVLAAAIWGCLIGSFINVVVLRIPKKLDWIVARSKCFSCEKKLNWWMNVPIFSYLLLKGRCYFCHKKIPIRYITMELLFSLKSIIIYLYVFSSDFTPSGNDIFDFFYLDLVISFLIAHVLIDFKYQILPDQINLILTILVLVKVLTTTHDYFDHFLGAIVGFGGTFIITYLFFLAKGKVGLGGGDIKLFGIVGLALGLQGVIVNLLLSSILGIFIFFVLAVLKKINTNQPFAFGPAIVLVFISQLLFPNYINGLLFPVL